MLGRDGRMRATRTLSRAATMPMPPILINMAVEPVGAGEDAPLEPALATVELGDEAQQAVVGRVDVGGELGYLVFQSFQRGARHG